MSDPFDPLVARLSALGVRRPVPFRRRELVDLALTHPTATNQASKNAAREHNQRLEHLGDAILGYLVADLLYDLLPEADEGRLSRIRAALTDESSLAKAASTLGLDRLLRVGPGERQTGLQQRPSVQADTFEALVAALSRSEGIDVAARLVAALFEDTARELGASRTPEQILDPKTRLQQVTQALRKETPTYRLVSKRGSEDAPTFVIEVLFADEVLGQGEGRTKKQAEQRAAEVALRLLDQREGAAGQLAGPEGAE